MSSNKQIDTTKTQSFLSRLLTQPRAPLKFSRWYLVPPTIAIHLSIGSMYSWSILNAPITHLLGVVSPSAGDWSFSNVVPIFSTIAFLHGLSAWLLADWQVKVGARRSLVYGAFAYGGGMMLAGLGAYLHMLPLMYLGYGIIGGIGLGLCYVPPMANLIRWFPDRTGLATGITICGFGGGAFVAAPIMQRMLSYARKAPDYLGSVDSVKTIMNPDGRLFADVAGELKEVVVSSKSVLSGWSELQEGLYVVGTGSSGASFTLSAMGTGYFMTMLCSAFLIKSVPEGYKVLTPKTNSMPMNQSSLQKSIMAFKSTSTHLIQRILPKKQILGNTESNVDIKTVMKTPQFYLIWTTFASLATAGMSIAGTAKDMVSEVFGSTMPDIVTPSFAAGYVVVFSLFNLGGRLFWSSFSDVFGRKNTFYIFTCAGVPLFLTIPLCTTQLTISTSSHLPALVAFYCSSMLIVSIFGGAYATSPAYATELFGRKSIGSVHGRLLTASSFAGFVGPVVVTRLRAWSEKNAIQDLVSRCDPELFMQKFGAPISEMQALIESKTLTIARLMEIMPVGTVDPTPLLYNSTMFVMAGVVGIAGISNKLIKKVPDRLYTLDEKNIKKIRDNVITKNNVKKRT